MNDGPIIEAAAKIRIMRIVIVKATSTFIEMNTGSLAIFAAIRRHLKSFTPSPKKSAAH